MKLSFLIRSIVSLSSFSIIFLLTHFYGDEKIGLLFSNLSLVTTVSTLGRFGWDQSIVNKNQIAIYFPNILLSSLLGGVAMLLLSRWGFYDKFIVFNLLSVLSLNLQSNLDAVLRLSRKTDALFYLVLGLPMLSLAVASYFLSGQMPQKIIFCSLFLTNAFTFIAIRIVEGSILIQSAPLSVLEGAKYFPLAVHGMINQNFWPLSLGQLCLYNLIPVAVICQRFLGVMTWPINKYQFTRVKDIKDGKLFFYKKESIRFVVLIGSLGALFSLTYCYLMSPILLSSIALLAIAMFFLSIMGDRFNYKIYNKKYLGAAAKQLICIFSAILAIRFLGNLGPIVLFFIYSLYLISICL